MMTKCQCCHEWTEDEGMVTTNFCYECVINEQVEECEQCGELDLVENMTKGFCNECKEPIPTKVWIGGVLQRDDV